MTASFIGFHDDEQELTFKFLTFKKRGYAGLKKIEQMTGSIAFFGQYELQDDD